jgi:hypothetical protein
MLKEGSEKLRIREMMSRLVFPEAAGLIECMDDVAIRRLEMIRPPQGFAQKVFGGFHSAGKWLAVGEGGGDGGGKRATRPVRAGDGNPRRGEAVDCALID